LLVPKKKLADAIAGEWRAQETHIRIENMPLTKLAYTAIDRVAPQRVAVLEQVLSFGKTDLVCYRAPEPLDLVQRQKDIWDSLVEWAKARFGAQLSTGEGIAYVEQPESARLAFEHAMSGKDDFRLAGLHTAVSLLGSLVIALALDEGVLDADAALAAARLDEIYQAEKWGLDPEAEARVGAQVRVLRELSRFLELLRQE
jgi:chaperone required for assembly of F1-ATPase